MNLTGRLIMTAAAAGLVLSGCSSGQNPSSTPGASASHPAATHSPVPSASQPPGSAGVPGTFGYQPLYPFASRAAARAWQAAYAAGGHQPWHLDARLTALSFTQGYLGFRGIDQVPAQLISGTDARVTVGFRLPNGHVSAAAIIHLVRYGSGANTPWEVVGTDDTTLTLDLPSYGSTVTSPVRIGGKITGVDENLRAEVHWLGAAVPVGSYCCRPAGGQASPWSLTVPFHASPGQVLTIVVHTGGHSAAVERFAVTGVRAG
jgi:acyl dehydratase